MGWGKGCFSPMAVLLESPFFVRYWNVLHSGPMTSEQLSMVNETDQSSASCKPLRTSGTQMQEQAHGYQLCKAQHCTPGGIFLEFRSPPSPGVSAPHFMSLMHSWPMVPGLSGCHDFLRKCLNDFGGREWNCQHFTFQYQCTSTVIKTIWTPKM